MRRFLECAVHASVIAQSSFPNTLRTFSEPIPRVLFMFANVFLEHDTKKKFHRLVPCVIHVFCRRQHGADAHVEGPQALIAVTHRGVDKADFVGHASSSGKSFNSFQPFKTLKSSFENGQFGLTRSALILTLRLIICINSYSIEQTAGMKHEKLS